MPRSGASMARPGNRNAARPRHHTDTVRLVLLDLDGVCQGLLKQARRSLAISRAAQENGREAHHQAAEISRLREEIREALDALDAYLVRAA